MKIEFITGASEGKAEVDFVLQIKNQIVPVEAKAGTNTHSPSLSVYREKYSPALSIKASLKNFKRQSGMLNIPLYAIFKLKNL